MLEDVCLCIGVHQSVYSLVTMAALGTAEDSQVSGC